MLDEVEVSSLNDLFRVCRCRYDFFEFFFWIISLDIHSESTSIKRNVDFGFTNYPGFKLYVCLIISETWVDGYKPSSSANSRLANSLKWSPSNISLVIPGLSD